MELAAKLYRGGFNSRQAGDIVAWLAELYDYERVDGLVALEDYYKEADELYRRSEPKKVGVTID